MAREPTELARIIRSIPTGRLIVLHKVNKDEELKKELVGTLQDILAMAQAQITRSAGVADSMDALVSIGISQAFYKGRISTAVLLHKLIEKSSAELERREESKKRGR